MNSKEYYSLLGIDRRATKDDIKKAYRKLAMECHPDVNADKDAETRFKALSEAYSVLSDSKKRHIYDLTGVSDFAGFGNISNQYFYRRRGMGGCMGRGMGKCSGFGAVFQRRPRKARKNVSNDFISE